MKAGQITAKLWDAVPACFHNDGAEVTRYKNTEIPDSLKEMEITDFHFNVAPDEKITLRLFFDAGMLPAEFPPARVSMTRAETKAAKAAKAAQAEAVAEETAAAIIETEAEAIAAAADNGTEKAADADESGSASESGETPAEEPAEDAAPAIPETRFNVTGEQRKALVAAIGEFAGIAPVYKAAPTFAYIVGEYTVDRTGTPIGETSPELPAALAEQDFTPET
jgi:hypothetical protein